MRYFLFALLPLLAVPCESLLQVLHPQIFEEKQARELAQSLLAQHSLRQAFAHYPPAFKWFEWSAL